MKKKILFKDKAQSANNETATRDTIGKIFPDGLILSNTFIIESVGENICNLLACGEEKYNGLPLSKLFGNALNYKKLTSLLESGHFENYKISMTNSKGDILSFTVSGFHLALIANVHDLIILKIRYIENIESISKQLYEKSRELDDFIYETSHKLRGPLATLKGLINLLKMDEGNDQLKAFITLQMGIFADRLDDKLHKLIYFAEADKGFEFSSEQLSINHIAEKLRNYANDGCVSRKIVFTEYLPKSITIIENGELIVMLLQNIKSFFCLIGTKDCEISFHVLKNDNFHEFELIANGIVLDDDQRKRIDIVNFRYTEILKYPEFTDLYSAKKITLKLKGRLQISVSDHKAHTRILIPRNT